MEVFEIHLEMTDTWGKKRPFISKPTFAQTGWEAAEKTQKFIFSRFEDVKSVELKYWKVLNPYTAHFLNNPIFDNQAK
ncbi:MAG: hypothetical protein M1445_11670 [Bacteroidetes bacterium]|nr:hypothetical protein [Bacteroidota bacterium]MCL6101610.1 hypothetical protein [Bacteroidota bacterium]